VFAIEFSSLVNLQLVLLQSECHAREARPLRHEVVDKIANDADRLRKYLARFDLEWGELKDRLRQT
jgi:sigma54-dependent transcription regulator